MNFGAKNQFKMAFWFLARKFKYLKNWWKFRFLIFEKWDFIDNFQRLWKSEKWLMNECFRRESRRNATWGRQWSEVAFILSPLFTHFGLGLFEVNCYHHVIITQQAILENTTSQSLIINYNDAYYYSARTNQINQRIKKTGKKNQ